MVSSLAAAISDVGLDADDHHLDCEHYPDLRHVALAYAWPSVGDASWLGDAGGIWMRRNRFPDSRFAPNITAPRSSMLTVLGSVRTVRRATLLYPGDLHRHPT